MSTENTPKNQEPESGTVGNLVISIAAFLVVATAWAVLPPPIYFLILGGVATWAITKAK